MELPKKSMSRSLFYATMYILFSQVYFFMILILILIIHLFKNRLKDFLKIIKIF